MFDPESGAGGTHLRKSGHTWGVDDVRLRAHFLINFFLFVM